MNSLVTPPDVTVFCFILGPFGPERPAVVKASAQKLKSHSMRTSQPCKPDATR